MKKSTANSMLFFIAMMSTAALAQGPKVKPVVPPTPAPTGAAADGKIDKWLDDNFDGVVKTCLTNMSKIKMKNNVNGSKFASGVPIELTNFLRQSGKTNYWRLGNVGANRIFAMVLSEDDIKNGTFPTDIRRGLLADLAQGAQELLLKGDINYQEFEQDCKAAFAYAASVGGGLAGDTIKAAGQTAVSANFSKRANLAAGTFVSPFASSWDGLTATSSAKFLTALIFWDWLSRNENAQGYLVRQFDGYTLTTSTQKIFEATAKAAGSGGFSVPFLSVKADVKGEYSGQTKYESEYFDVISTSPLDKSTAEYLKLPTENDLIYAIENNKTISIKSSGGDGILIGGLRQTSFVDIWNVPKRLCDTASNYEITGTSADQMTISSIVDYTKDGYCRFIVTYQPSTTIGTGTVKAPFSIHRKKAGLPTTMAGFSIPIDNLEYRWSNTPKIQPKANLLFSYVEPAGGNEDYIVWKSTGVIDDRNLLMNGPVQLDNIKLPDTCKIAGRISEPDGVMMLANRRTGLIDYELTIKVKTRKPETNNSPNNAPIAAQDCDINGTLVYDVPQQGQITRSLGDIFTLHIPATAINSN